MMKKKSSEEQSAGMSVLSEDCFGVVKCFLSEQEFLSLSHSSKEVYEECRSLKMYKLNKHHSLLYHDDEEFREQVKRTISSPRQVTLDLSEYDNVSDVSDVSALGGVHTLSLNGCRYVSDVSALGGVHTLDLSMCDNN